MEQLLAICGAVSIVGGAVGFIAKAIVPVFKVKKDVEQNIRDIEAIKEHERNDFESIKALQKMNREQIKGMVAMLNHMIDGNGVDAMKETRDNLLTLLIDD